MTNKPVRTFFAALTLLAVTSGSVLTGIVPSSAAAGFKTGLAPISQKQTHYIAGGDCAEIGQKVAAAQGGTLTKATAAVQNGAPVCIVVVLVPGRDGERPRRVEVAVPAK
ncbi:hypothetical protein MP213Fo_06620 [Pseudochrobactrum sp. MP213Fo]